MQPVAAVARAPSRSALAFAQTREMLTGVTGPAFGRQAKAQVAPRLGAPFYQESGKPPGPAGQPGRQNRRRGRVLSGSFNGCEVFARGNLRPVWNEVRTATKEQSLIEQGPAQVRRAPDLNAVLVQPAPVPPERLEISCQDPGHTQRERLVNELYISAIAKRAEYASTNGPPDYDIGEGEIGGLSRLVGAPLAATRSGGDRLPQRLRGIGDREHLPV